MKKQNHQKCDNVAETRPRIQKWRHMFLRRVLSKIKQIASHESQNSESAIIFENGQPK